MVSNASEQESAKVSTTQLQNNDTNSLLSAPQSSVPPMQRLNSSQSLAHLPRDTTFILHERGDSDQFDITSISTADEWTRSHGTLPQHIRLHPCETMQTTGKRPSFVGKLFRSKSANTTLPLQDDQGDYFAHSSPTNDSSSVSIPMGDDNSNLNNPHAILYRSATLDASNYPNLIGDNDNEEIGLQQSDRNTPMNRTNTAFTNTERSLSRSTTATTMNSSSNATRPPSRFSFISRRTTRLRSVLSRPPSYKRYDDPDQEEQQARDIAALRRLEQCYENDRNAGLLHQLIWAEEGEKVPMKQVLTSCVASQFTGFYMAFWVIIFVFLGAVSVFVPDLPQAAKALWIPLALYCVGVLVFFGYHRRHAMEIDQLEQQVGRARRRRLNELLTNMELPNDHYFVIEDRSSSHAHPVITLLPPPPNYAPMTRPTISGTASTSTRHNAGDEFLSPSSQQQRSDSFSLSPTSTNSPSAMLQVPSSIPPYPQSPSQPQQQQQYEQNAGEHDDSTHRWQVSQAEETMELEHSNHPLYRPS